MAFRRFVQQPADKSLRTCVTCKETKPMAGGFYRCKPGCMNDRTYGCSMPCIECNRARIKGYKRTAEQRARDAETKRRPDVMEKSRLRSRDWYQSGPGRENARAYGAKRYAEHRDEMLAANRKRYHSDHTVRERMAVAQKAKRATPEGRAAHNASNAKFKNSDRGRLVSRMHTQIRRARLYSTVCDLTDKQWLAMVDAYNGQCAYCESTNDITIDHIVAVSRGGEHTLSNVAPACKRCNLKKNAKSLEDALVALGVSHVDFLKRRDLALLRLRTEVDAPT